MLNILTFKFLLTVFLWIIVATFDIFVALVCILFLSVIIKSIIGIITGKNEKMKEKETEN